MGIAQASTPPKPHSVGPRRRVPLSEPVFEGNEWKYLKECLETGWVSSAGPFVERFEREVAAAVGAAHAVALINGTAALHTALQVVGVKPNDEVLVSDLTFVAPVNAIRYCQAHPILVDAHPTTWQLDVDLVDRFLSGTCEVRGDACYNRTTGRRVRAIVPVHILGLACEIDRLVELAHHYHLIVVEDAAEAMGVRYHGRHVGTYGDIGVLSFNGNKIMTSGGGGMLLTEDAALASYARYLTTQAKDDPDEFIHHEVGYNYRLSNVQAAIGLAQLEQLPGFIEHKRAIAHTYDVHLGQSEALTLMPVSAQMEATYWLYTVLLKPGTTRSERQRVVQSLNRAGFEARSLWCPIHELPPYRNCQTLRTAHATSLYERAVSLPSGVGVTVDEVADCAQTLMRSLQTR